MSKTQKINNNADSKSKIITKNINLFSVIDFQLEIIDIGAINVVNNIKYIDKPSTPR
jgi:hypothetical protein